MALSAAVLALAGTAATDEPGHLRVSAGRACAPVVADEDRFVFSDHRPDTVVGARTTAPVVALSFDDGPDPRFTPDVLRILEQRHERATFFVVGREVAGHRALFRRLVDAGMEVGDHTWDHPELPQLGPAAVRSEIDRAATSITAAGGPRPVLFRAPKGDLSRADARALCGAGVLSVGWTACLEHYLHDHSIDDAVRRLARDIRPGGIIVAHDGRLDRHRSVAALGPLLDALAARGFRVVTVGELLGLTAATPSV
jgi:peptidoglycan/xylan/chitin deacetylase (PgdA/CDA1 family)